MEKDVSVFQAMKFKMHHAEVKKTCTGVIDTICYFIACRPEFFKDSKGNMNYSLCSGNSFSLTTGSLRCTCHSGFDRTEEDPLSSACTSKYFDILVSFALIK